MSRNNSNSNSCLDFIFRVPKKLTFTALYRYYFDFILRLLYRVILLDNVPKTVNETFMKMILYTQGKVCFLDGQLIGEEGEQLLSLNCTRADTPDVYYIPRKVLVTNPRLKKQYNLEPGVDCCVVYLSEPDKYQLAEFGGGLYELIRRTAVMLADNDISLNIGQKNTRLTNLVSGDTQNTVDSIRAVITSMYEGDPTIVVKSSLIDKLQGIPIIENTSQQNLIQLIEVQQYIISHFYEQIGICTHDQMKKERLITAEINDNLELAFLNIDDILESLREGFARVNAMFGTNITVRLNPLIEQQREEKRAALALSTEDAAAEEEAAAEEDQTEEAAPEEEAAADEDQTEDAAPEEEAAAEDQTEDAAPEEEAAADEDQTEDAAPEEEAAADEDQTEDAAPEEAAAADEDQTEDAAPEEAASEGQTVGAITIEGNNNTIIIEGGDVNAGTDTAPSDDEDAAETLDRGDEGELDAMG